MASLDLQPVDSVTVTTLMDNSIDSLLPNQGPAVRHPLMSQDTGPFKEAPLYGAGKVSHELRAEHGYAALIEFQTGDESHTVLFDSGRTVDGLSSNMQCLGIDLDQIQAIVLSHGHADHTGGLNGLLAENRGRLGKPVYVHPEAFLATRDPKRGGSFNYAARLSLDSLAETGCKVTESAEATMVLPGLAVTGEVPRRTQFEVTGSATSQKQINGRWAVDKILDEQAAVMNLRDQGLVVLVGCSHPGIINILNYARAITGIDRVHAVIGGFHLSGNRAAPAITPTVDAMAEFSPDLIVPSHCSGHRAAALFAERMPEAFIPNSVGTKFSLGV